MVATIDVILIAAYFIAIALIGYFSSRRESSGDYLIASKKLGVWQNVSTITSTKITASIIITFVALVYVFGISAIWAFIGTAFGYILFLLFAIKLKREGDKNNYHSIADYFRHRYGEGTGRIVGIFIFLTIFLNFTIQLIGGAKILNSLTGLSFSLAVLLAGGVVLFYLYLGGFKAVIKTDIVQFVAIILLFCVLGVFLFSNFTFEAAQWDMVSAGPGLIIPLILIGLLFPFSAPDLWQRALAAKSTRALKKSFFVTTAIYMVFGLLLSLIAIIIRLKLPNIEADVALVEGFAHLLPSGLLGAGLVALFAAIMSSADSYAFISAGILVHDILPRKRGRSVGALRGGILVVMLLGVISAMAFKSILDASFLLGGLFMVVSVIVVATWIKKEIKATTLNVGVLVGLLITVSAALVVGMTPTLVVAGVCGGLVGLGIGAMTSKIAYRKTREFTYFR